ncbi:MAG TPA: cytochrome C biosynthesis protein [Planctomycetota bacterium]|nr:cytochrome C biosynthesis protein [Planctomycetota bacterium]
MKRLSLLVVSAAVAAAAAAAVVWTLSGRPPVMGTPVSIDHAPRLSPDYAGCVIPPNIAPLNFVVKEPAAWYHVRIAADKGEPIEITGRSPVVVIPLGAWKRLLGANRGGKLTCEVCVWTAEGGWRRFAPLEYTVADEEIDAWVVYREMPVYNMVWNSMAIRQRCLEDFDETVILHGKSYGGGCPNCHTFYRNLPDRMVMNVRGVPPPPLKPPGGMLLAENGRVSRVVDTRTALSSIPATYLAWHPSGKAVSFSMNSVLQCFNTLGEHRDVIDRDSDLGLYLVESNTVTTSPEICRPDRHETYTTWTADGRTLYYCSAPKLPMKRYKESRYDLMRIPYDIETNTWGKPETVIASRRTGLSVSHPRCSPDGKWLMFCMARYGNFPAFRPSSDLYMMDMETGKFRPLDINSYKSEAWHSWSSNSRWIVFASKRRDGLFARLYLSYVDRTGKAHKPFILPQKDPTFYDSYLLIHNVPELVKSPLRLKQRDVIRALFSAEKCVQAALDPGVEVRKPAAPPDEASQYETGPGG